MAWPFGSSDKSGEAQGDLSEERLRVMSNIAIEQVPMPEQGELTEEDAWTISPGPLGLDSTVLELCQLHHLQVRHKFRQCRHIRSRETYLKSYRLGGRHTQQS